MIDELANASWPDLENHPGVRDAALLWEPTGPPRATQQDLADLQMHLRAAAESVGYVYGRPDGPPLPDDQAVKAALDVALARVLHLQMPISAHEASHPEVWAYVAIVIAPELVRWRFGGEEGTSEQRYRGSIRRNLFGRLWWRAHALVDPTSSNPFHLLEALGEDEQVQIAERPNLAGDSDLARQLARSVLRHHDPRLHSNRSELTRNVTLRILRRLRWIDFQSLDRVELEAVLDGIVVESLVGLGLPVPSSTGSHAVHGGGDKRGVILARAIGRRRLAAAAETFGRELDKSLLRDLARRETNTWRDVLTALDEPFARGLVSMLVLDADAEQSAPHEALLQWLLAG